MKPLQREESYKAAAEIIRSIAAEYDHKTPHAYEAARQFIGILEVLGIVTFED